MMYQGYIILGDTLFGGYSYWKAGKGEEMLPWFHTTLEEARIELVQDYIENLTQFVEGTRSWEDTDISGPEDFICYCEIDDKENMLVYYVLEDKSHELLLTTTLKKWREDQ